MDIYLQDGYSTEPFENHKTYSSYIAQIPLVNGEPFKAPEYLAHAQTIDEKRAFFDQNEGWREVSPQWGSDGDV